MYVSGGHDSADYIKRRKGEYKNPFAEKYFGKVSGVSAHEKYVPDPENCPSVKDSSQTGAALRSPLASQGFRQVDDRRGPLCPLQKRPGYIGFFANVPIPIHRGGSQVRDARVAYPASFPSSVSGPAASEI